MAAPAAQLPPLPLVILLLAAAMAAPRPCSAVDPVATYCAKNGTTAQTQANIDAVLASLVPRASAAYYAVSTSGSGADAVHGLAQCRGDVPRQDCALCLSAAARALASSCRGSGDARAFYDYCLLRYLSGGDNFIGLPDTGYTLILLNTQNASGVDLGAFDRAQSKLMARVAAEAGDDDRSKQQGLARETAKLGSSMILYGLGWCTRDITPADCGLCVAQAVAELPNYCRYRRGCRVIYSSCMARYETYPFFFPGDGGRQGDDSAEHAGEYAMVVHDP